jgi:hypothetical protein
MAESCTFSQPLEWWLKNRRRKRKIRGINRTIPQTQSFQETPAPFCQILDNGRLHVTLEWEKIHILPIASVYCQPIPVTTNLGTSAQWDDIQERKYPKVYSVYIFKPYSEIKYIVLILKLNIRTSKRVPWAELCLSNLEGAACQIPRHLIHLHLASPGFETIPATVSLSGTSKLYIYLCSILHT